MGDHSQINKPKNEAASTIPTVDKCPEMPSQEFIQGLSPFVFKSDNFYSDVRFKKLRTNAEGSQAATQLNPSLTLPLTIRNAVQSHKQDSKTRKLKYKSIIIGSISYDLDIHSYFNQLRIDFNYIKTRLSNEISFGKWVNMALGVNPLFSKSTTRVDFSKIKYSQALIPEIDNLLFLSTFEDEDAMKSANSIMHQIMFDIILPFRTNAVSQLRAIYINLRTIREILVSNIRSFIDDPGAFTKIFNVYAEYRSIVSSILYYSLENIHLSRDYDNIPSNILSFLGLLSDKEDNENRMNFIRELDFDYQDLKNKSEEFIKSIDTFFDITLGIDLSDEKKDYDIVELDEGKFNSQKIYNELTRVKDPSIAFKVNKLGELGYESGLMMFDDSVDLSLTILTTMFGVGLASKIGKIGIAGLKAIGINGAYNFVSGFGANMITDPIKNIVRDDNHKIDIDLLEKLEQSLVAGGLSFLTGLIPEGIGFLRHRKDKPGKTGGAPDQTKEKPGKAGKQDKANTGHKEPDIQEQYNAKKNLEASEEKVRRLQRQKEIAEKYEDNLKDYQRLQEQAKARDELAHNAESVTQLESRINARKQLKANQKRVDELEAKVKAKSNLSDNQKKLDRLKDIKAAKEKWKENINKVESLKKLIRGRTEVGLKGYRASLYAERNRINLISIIEGLLKRLNASKLTKFFGKQIERLQSFVNRSKGEIVDLHNQIHGERIDDFEKINVGKIEEKLKGVKNEIDTVSSLNEQLRDAEVQLAKSTEASKYPNLENEIATANKELNESLAAKNTPNLEDDLKAAKAKLEESQRAGELDSLEADLKQAKSRLEESKKASENKALDDQLDEAGKRLKESEDAIKNKNIDEDLEKAEAERDRNREKWEQLVKEQGEIPDLESKYWSDFWKEKKEFLTSFLASYRFSLLFGRKFPDNDNKDDSTITFWEDSLYCQLFNMKGDEVNLDMKIRDLQGLRHILQKKLEDVERQLRANPNDEMLLAEKGRLEKKRSELRHAWHLLINQYADNLKDFVAKIDH